MWNGKTEMQFSTILNALCMFLLRCFVMLLDLFDCFSIKLQSFIWETAGDALNPFLLRCGWWQSQLVKVPREKVSWENNSILKGEHFNVLTKNTLKSIHNVFSWLFTPRSRAFRPQMEYKIKTSAVKYLRMYFSLFYIINKLKLAALLLPCWLSFFS